MIFVDSNIPTYLGGNPHSNRDRALETLDRLTGNREILVTDTDVYQEILHCYSSIGRRELIDRVFSRLNELVHQVLIYGMPEIHTARGLLDSVRGISARDALHVAVMRSAGITRIFSYDAGFDSVPGIERLE